MADRFWVGGTGTWNTTNTTNWSATSGGTGGASVPTSVDDVYFDGLSGGGTVTVSNTVVCQGFFPGPGSGGSFTGNFASSGTAIIQVYSIVDFSFYVRTFSTTIAFQFLGTANNGAIISNGYTLFSITVNKAGKEFYISGALTCNSSITHSAGTFNTQDYNVTALSFLSSSTNTRVINFGSSVLTLTQSTPINLNPTNLTFNAGTSQINCSASTVTFNGNGQTFYNVSFTNTALTSSAITGANTFNNLTVTAPSAAGVTQVMFDSSQTINGTLGTTGTAGNRRVWFRGATYGIAQTLTINSAPSLTDADFRDIYVIGTAAPISGTRIGDLRGTRGITTSTPKTVYWNLAGAQDWSANGWAATSGGTPSTDNFPLAQDTAVFDNTGSVTGNISISNTFSYTGTVDMSNRTSAMTFVFNAATPTIYGDWKNGSGTTLSGTGVLTFSGRNTQTITSAGKTFSCPITIDSYGGTVQLADALNIGTNTLTVTNGTFDTKNFNVTAGSLSSSNSNVRTIALGSSTVTLSGVSTPIVFTTPTNLTLNAGTSSITSNYTAGATFQMGGQTFYDVTQAGAAASPINTFAGGFTCRNLTLGAPSSANIISYVFSANATINGTLTCAGATAVRRIFVRSNTLGTTRTLTVNTLSATDCDFRDVTIAGTAAGSSPTRAGDCGGNSGITFPGAKTVYWNLAGTQNWSDTAWASSSGGTPAVNNFPLAQDTAVFDNAGSAGTVIIQTAWNIGTFNASARTSAWNFQFSSPASVYGNWSFGSGATTFNTGNNISFQKNGTQTITSNGKTFGDSLVINSVNGTVQLADAFVCGAGTGIALTSGTFDAVNYNVTATGFASNNTNIRTLKMGSGTWTMTGNSAPFDLGTTTNLSFYKGTANIIFTDTTVNGKSFSGGGLSYNKFTIGGATGTSTLTITGNNQFTELASTKTVAHTIALGTTTQTVGAWTVTGTAGNVVTVSGTGTIIIAGARVSGVDYLALGTTTISATSPGEFYAGANSTGGTNAVLTAAPAATTRYWRGGTGTWSASSTTNWSASSGGSGGASVPTSADAVVFDSASNATAYTVTCTATQLRCASLTMAGPASGNVTWAGTAPLTIHGNVSLAATGITRSYTGTLTLSGSATGKTFTTNGNTLASAMDVNGVGCGWSLGSALTTGTANTITVTNGSFDLANYNLSASAISSSSSNGRTIIMGSGTTTLAGNIPITFGTIESARAALTFTANTSQINCSGTASPQFNGNNQTFYNVAFTATSSSATLVVNGANTFNNLSYTGITSAGLRVVAFYADQTINGTLTLSAGTNATMRTFLQSDTLGTTRTLTCAAFSGTDADFQDITIAGAAAPVSGTRLGDCKGNSGITFDAPKTVYYAVGTGLNWGGTSWAFTNGGTADVTAFPLAQDTAVFPSSPTARPGPGGASTINAAYNIGTIDMSARTANTMTLATGTTTPAIYGNWINGTGTTLTGTGTLTFAGRGSQTITSAGVTFTQPFTINTPGGSVALQDAFTNSSGGINISQGTFDAVSYNVTFSAANSTVSTNYTTTRTLAIGSGTWTVAGSTGVWTSSSTNLTITGTGTISLTSASAKTFAGGGLAYTNITLNQGGAGALTITGNNTFKDITNTYSATGATNITIGTTTQTVSQWTATGASGKVLTVQGTSASSPGTLILSGATDPNVDYLAVTGVRAYSLTDTWYAGNNSTNSGSLGWIFTSGSTAIFAFITETARTTDANTTIATLNLSLSETARLSDTDRSRLVFFGNLSESATVADAVAAVKAYLAAVIEGATSSDVVAAARILYGALQESVRAQDSLAVQSLLNVPVSELAALADTVSGALVLDAALSEAVSVADVATAILIFNRAVAEAASVAEVLAAVAVFKAVVPEQVVGQDVARALVRFAGRVNEQLNALDAVSPKKTTRPSISETARASEAITNKYDAYPRLTERAAFVDAFQVVASTFSATLTNTVTATDRTQGANTGSSSLSESAAASETQSAKFTAVANTLEQGAAQDSLSALMVFRTGVSELAAAQDSTSVAPSVFSATAAAAAAVFDNFNPAGSIYNAALPIEGASAADSLIGAYLWNVINTAQDPNWTNIQNPQNPNWTAIDDSHDPGWQNIDIT